MAAAAPPPFCNANAHQLRSTPGEPAQPAPARRCPWLCLPGHSGPAPPVPAPPPGRPPAGRRPPGPAAGRLLVSGSGLRPGWQASPGQPGAPRRQGRHHQPSPGLAWWTRHPQANIGLATGHAFDVLDVDGPEGAHAIQAFAAEHGLESSGPLVRTGGGGWHYYLAPTGLGNAHPAELNHVDWRGRGGYVVAPPSRHASGHPYQWIGGRNLDVPLADVPTPLRRRLNTASESGPPTRSISCDFEAAPGTGTGRRRWPPELARVAAAPVGGAQPAAVGVGPQPLQPGWLRRPRRA